MSSANYGGSRHIANVGILGHKGHGKTTLTAAITKLISIKDFVDFEANNFVDDAAEESESELKRMGVAILVVSAADGTMPQTQEHIQLAHQVGISNIIVFLNKVDQVDDCELVELVEDEIRELLYEYDFPGQDTPIIKGSAINALESTSTNPNASEYKCIVNLMNTVIRCFSA